MKWMTRQPAVGEESLTDWLLYELSERISWIHYRKFTRYAESRETGADWEWWFVATDGAIGARVQAKKVVDGDDQYRGLAHTSRSGLQIELLLESARSRSLLPLYASYYAPKSTPQVRCGARTPPGRAEGVFIGDAQLVYTSFIQAGRKSVAATDLVSDSNPLACFVCCPLTLGRGPGQRMWEFFTSYYPAAVQVALGESPSAELGRPHPPTYVLSLLETQSVEGVDDQFERQYSEALADVNGLVIFDLREATTG